VVALRVLAPLDEGLNVWLAVVADDDTVLKGLNAVAQLKIQVKRFLGVQLQAVQHVHLRGDRDRDVREIIAIKPQPFVILIPILLLKRLLVFKVCQRLSQHR